MDADGINVHDSNEMEDFVFSKGISHMAAVEKKIDYMFLVEIPALFFCCVF